MFCKGGELFTLQNHGLLEETNSAYNGEKMFQAYILHTQNLFTPSITPDL